MAFFAATGTAQKSPESLKNTEWNSQFYHYANFYVFETDSTGYFQDGQVGWSTGIDPQKLVGSEDKVFYNDSVQFTYALKNNVLTITYPQEEDGSEMAYRIFDFRSEDQHWVSQYEYAYGKEVLMTGERLEQLVGVLEVTD